MLLERKARAYSLRDAELMSDPAKRILIVDDNVDSAELTADMLRAHGFDVAVATDALAALELAATFLPNVALLDIGLPGMDGYELARRLAQSCAGCQLIAVTGYAAEHDRMRSQVAGFAIHLTKPVTMAAILAAITVVDATSAASATRAQTHTGDEGESPTSAGAVDIVLDALRAGADRR